MVRNYKKNFYVQQNLKKTVLNGNKRKRVFKQSNTSLSISRYVCTFVSHSIKNVTKKIILKTYLYQHKINSFLYSSDFTFNIPLEISQATCIECNRNLGRNVVCRNPCNVTMLYFSTQHHSIDDSCFINECILYMLLKLF